MLVFDLGPEPRPGFSQIYAKYSEIPGKRGIESSQLLPVDGPNNPTVEYLCGKFQKWTKRSI
jgi:hypothetical protein